MMDQIKYLENRIEDPNKGLPDEIFYFIGRNTSYANVDLLIRTKDWILLTWREDIVGSGWHFPGGIIRFRETMLDRVKMVAKSELGVKVINIKGPQKISEVISHDIKERSHFISFLFECELDNFYFDKIKGLMKKQPGKLSFFKEAPKDLLKNHLIYSEYFN